MPLDIVQVQIVGNDPWAALLPLVAILISVASVVLTFWFRWSDSAKVELMVTSAIVGTEPPRHFVAVKATNKGRAGTTVVESVVLVPKSGKVQLIPTRFQPWETPLPWTLGPGESKTRYFPEDWVATVVEENALDPKSFRARASTGHGEYKSRKSDLIARILNRQPDSTPK